MKNLFSFQTAQKTKKIIIPIIKSLKNGDNNGLLPMAFCFAKAMGRVCITSNNKTHLAYCVTQCSESLTNGIVQISNELEIECDFISAYEKRGRIYFERKSWNYQKFSLKKEDFIILIDYAIQIKNELYR